MVLTTQALVAKVQGQHLLGNFLNLCNHLFKHWCPQNIEEPEKEIVQTGMSHMVVGRGKTAIHTRMDLRTWMH